GTFGPIDMSRLYATGISSGGYMTSRMAVSYAGMFKALAVQSGSYATCAGLLCAIPDRLPSDHPPTLFLHGRVDLIVPLLTMQMYADRLTAEGHPVKVVIDDSAGHRTLARAPNEILAWFEAHP